MGIAGSGTTYTTVVDDLDNGGELALVGTASEENDTANLDQTPGGGDDGCVSHCDLCAVGGKSVRGFAVKRTSE